MESNSSQQCHAYADQRYRGGWDAETNTIVGAVLFHPSDRRFSSAWGPPRFRENLPGAKKHLLLATLTAVAGSTVPGPSTLIGYRPSAGEFHLRLNATGLHRRDPFGIIGGNIVDESICTYGNLWALE